MKKFYLLTKTLLVAALLMVGVSNVWADTEWQLAWADYFEDASAYTTNISWSSTNNLTISQADRPDGVSGKYYYVYDNGGNGRNWTFSIGNAYTASGTSWSKYTYDADEAYKVEFDIAFRSDRFNNSSGSDQTFTIPNLVTMTLPKATTTATFRAINAYAAGSIAAGDELFTISAAYDYSSTGNVFGNHFYHFIVEGRSTGTTLSVYGPYSTGAYSNTPVYSAKLSDSKIDLANINGTVQRYYSSMGLDNVELYKEVEAGFIETPTAAITAVDGKNRTVSFSCATDGVTLSYSTDGGSSYTDGTSLVISENTNIIVKATKGVSSATSESQLFEAGTTVTLNTPSTSVTALTVNANGLYYPTVSASYDPSGVLLSPNATLSAKFNGSTVSLPYVATTEGTLVITASYEGYESAEYNYNVVGYAKVLWKDYTTYDTSSRPDGLRKWSGDSHWEIAEGYGYKAVRGDGNAWCQIDKAGMVAYDKLSEASGEAVTSTIILVNNHNTGNDDLQYFSNGTVLSKIYYFTEGKSVTITAAGWATYCRDKALDFSSVSGLKAYIVTGTVDETSELDLTQVSSVPANTGVLFEGNAGTYSIPVAASSATDVSSNKLVGVLENTGIDAEAGYVLMNETAGVGFYKNKNAFTVGANTAYLPADFATSVVTARAAYFFRGNITEVENVEAAPVATVKKNGAYLENGRIAIYKNGMKFNANGQLVK